MKTSGIVASYNYGKYISESVTSLAKQCDEVIVADDNSSDNSAYEIEKLCKQFNNIIFDKNVETMGISYTFNKAVNISTGDLIFIQGADDISSPNRVKTQRQSLASAEIIISFSLPDVIGARGNALPENVAPEFVREVNGSYMPELLINGNFICAPSVAMRRSDFLSLGGFRLGLQAFQDYDLWLRASRIGGFFREELPIIKYRKHDSNYSRPIGTADSLRKIRLDAELELIVEEFCDGLSEADISLIERSGFRLPRLFRDLPVNELEAAKVAVMMIHSNRSIREVGVRKYIEIVTLTSTQPDSINLFESEMQRILPFI